MIKLNFEATDSDKIYCLPEYRIVEVANILALAALDISLNHTDYSFERTGEDSNRIGVHKGKCLQRMLRDLSEIQEQLFAISMFEVLIDSIVQQVAARQAKDFLNKLNDNLQQRTTHL